MIRAFAWISRSLAAVFAALTLAGCSQLGLFNAVIPKDDAVLVAHNVAYGSDPRQKLDLYAPDRAVKDAPVIVFVYGGSWSSGDKREYAFAGKALASRGYLTAVIDYRLVPKVRYPAFVEDTAKAVAWTYRNAGTYGGNSRRVYLVGHSAGAYNAAMVAVAPEFLRAEGLSPSIIRAFAGLSGPYDFLPLDVDATREAFKGVKDLPRTQPVNRIGGAYVPPMLLVHGDADTLVYPKNMTALAKAMRRGGHPVETKLYPGIDHPGTLLALSRPLRNKAPVLDDVDRFLKRH